MEEMRDGAGRVSGTERIRVMNSGSGNTAVEDSGASHGDWWFPTVPLGHTVCLSISLRSLYLMNTWDFDERPTDAACLLNCSSPHTKVRFGVLYFENVLFKK
jgi:hypothetical protein